MSSNDPSEVTFEKVKSNGAVVKKRVPTFRDGDWKDWLEWRLRLSEYYVFMGYAADDEEDQVAFVEDIQVLLFDEDLQQFNDTVAEESILRPTTVALVALQRLTESHSPDGTRGVILDEMSALTKTRNVSVQEYTRSFRKLGRMLNYITDNEAIPTSDVIRMYKNGMPIDWQIEVNRLSRSWENGGRGSYSRAGQSAQQQQKGKSQERGQVSRQNNQNSQSRGQPRHHRNNGNNGKYCKFCKRNNHSDAECFRNPVPPAYRPRRPNNRGSGTNKNHNNGGGDSDRAFAAMQKQVAEMAAMMQEMKRHQEEELSALRLCRQDELSVMTDDEVVDEQPPNDKRTTILAPLRQQRAPAGQKPCLETKVCIGEQTFRALLDTGCTRSSIDQRIANIVKKGLTLRRQEGSYLMANRSVQKTTHVADTSFAYQHFEQACVLGRIRIPMHVPPPPAAKVGASAPMLGPQPPVAKADKTELDVDSMVEVAVSELVEALDPLMMIDGKMLSPSERVEVEQLVEAFLHVCSGGLGKIKAKP
ncbi:unnamed protein product [Phytophthora fragariaefolia]|uniref:Unnamed protein product n=1 Tax=Phytophthora fragariaefolia TaxID=1490495 RepID=A0A9W6Y6P7_9STRA|nr:unnamed protein product [Phytophthora fragariaefolia]